MIQRRLEFIVHFTFDGEIWLHWTTRHESTVSAFLETLGFTAPGALVPMPPPSCCHLVIREAPDDARPAKNRSKGRRWRYGVVVHAGDATPDVVLVASEEALAMLLEALVATAGVGNRPPDEVPPGLEAALSSWHRGRQHVGLTMPSTSPVPEA